MNNPIKTYFEEELTKKQIKEYKINLLKESPIQPRTKVEHITGGPIMVVIGLEVKEVKDYTTGEITLTLRIECEYFNKNRQEFKSTYFSINALNIVE